MKKLLTFIMTFMLFCGTFSTALAVDVNKIDQASQTAQELNNNNPNAGTSGDIISSNDAGETATEAANGNAGIGV